MYSSRKMLRYYFISSTLPTQFNLIKYLRELGWRRSFFAKNADFSDKNLQFHVKATETLEFKHLLAQLVDKFCKDKDVMPKTYCIEESNFIAILEEIKHKYYSKNNYFVDEVKNLIWILKPALQNNGNNIKIFTSFSTLVEHFLSNNRLGGPHVLQQYIINPHLLKGHKYSMRFFVILTNYDGAYIYPQGYFNVALLPFDPYDFTNLKPHLTNEHLSCDNLLSTKSNIIQIPATRFDFFQTIYSPVKTIIYQVLRGLQNTYVESFMQQEHRNLAFLGFDFMCDCENKVWLLEVNHGPCFPTNPNHALQKFLYINFWQDLIQSFIVPIATNILIKDIKYLNFEKIL